MVSTGFPVQQKTGPLCWILYDGISAEQTAKELELDEKVVNQLKNILAITSPLWGHFKRFSDITRKERNLYLTGGSRQEIAAIIAPPSSGDYKKRSVVCYRTARKSDFVSIPAWTWLFESAITISGHFVNTKWYTIDHPNGGVLGVSFWQVSQWPNCDVQQYYPWNWQRLFLHSKIRNSTTHQTIRV